MTRAHRTWHIVSWATLAPLLALGLALALIRRPPAFNASDRPVASSPQAIVGAARPAAIPEQSP